MSGETTDCEFKDDVALSCLEAMKIGLTHDPKAVAEFCYKVASEFVAIRGTGKRAYSKRKKTIGIYEVGLSNRTINCLLSARVDTLDKLCRKSTNSLKRIPGFGAKCLREVNAVLSNKKYIDYVNKSAKNGATGPASGRL